METVRLTMAQALVRFLENQYISYDGKEHPFVEGVIMLPGHGNVLGLGQALAQETHHLKVWQGKNEQGMAHTAIAFAKQCKRKKIIIRIMTSIIAVVMFIYLYLHERDTIDSLLVGLFAALLVGPWIDKRVKKQYNDLGEEIDELLKE